MVRAIGWSLPRGYVSTRQLQANMLMTVDISLSGYGRRYAHLPWVGSRICSFLSRSLEQPKAGALKQPETMNVAYLEVVRMYISDLHEKRISISFCLIEVGFGMRGLRFAFACVRRRRVDCSLSCMTSPVSAFRKCVRFSVISELRPYMKCLSVKIAIWDSPHTTCTNDCPALLRWGILMACSVDRFSSLRNYHI